MAEDIKKEAKTEAPKKKSNWIALIVALLTILVIVQGIKIVLDYQNKEDLKEQTKEVEKEHAVTIQQLSDISLELDEKIKEVEELGGNVKDLEEAKAEIEQELTNTRRVNRTSIRRLQGKVEGYEALLVAKDKEIEELNKLAEQLYSENTDLKSERNQLTRTITELNQSKNELETKIDIASTLKAENVRIIGLISRDRERESPFRARQLNELKIMFSIAENDVAPIEGKEIMIRILDPQSNVLFDVTKGSGTFMLDGKEEFYTAKQEILFDNSKQELTFHYTKGSEYETGNYQVEIYTPQYLMGTGAFVVQ